MKSLVGRQYPLFRSPVAHFLLTRRAGEVVEVGFVERRPNEVREYRARYRDPLGQQRSKSFSRRSKQKILATLATALRPLACPNERWSS